MREEKHMAKKRFSYDQYTDALTQARENRDAEWLEEHDALHAKLEAEEIDIDTYWEWMGENPRPSETVLQNVHSRKLMKKKSKKNIQKKIVIVDEEALREVRMEVPKVEWSESFSPGCLVETRNGDIGIIVAEHNEKYGGAKRAKRPSWIKKGMEDSYVKLLVNGVEEWHKKFSVSFLDD